MVYDYCCFIFLMLAACIRNHHFPLFPVLTNDPYSEKFPDPLFEVTGKTLLALVGVFIAVELLLTLLGGAGAPSVVFVENEGYRYVPNISFTSIGRLSHTLAPLRINAHGFRDEDWEKYSDDSFHQRSLIGDSVVAALDTCEPCRLIKLLELKLSDGSTGRWQVMNMGIGGQQVINYLDQVY